jgi:hypothetical protein
MAVIEMAFTREEENGIQGGPTSTMWRGEVGGPAAAATWARRPWAGGRGRSKQRRWGTDMWAPWHSVGRPGQTTFNRFQNQFKLIQKVSKLFKLLKNDLPELNFFLKNMVVKGLKRGTTFSIGTS